MKKPFLIAALTLTLACPGIVSAADGSTDGADLVLVNARIFTGRYQGEKPEFARAMACKDGKIVYVGSIAEASRLKTAGAKTHDLGGKIVLPGLHDCHVHLCESGLERKGCQLYGVKDKAKALRKLQQYAATLKGKDKNQWLKASGLPLPAVAKSALTTAEIDAVVNDRPAIIYSEDAHSLWLNSPALRLAKIDADTVTPATGVIERDKNNKPNGAFREAAMDLVEESVPLEPLPERLAALRDVVLLANSLGLTSIQDAHAKEPILDTYAALAEKNELNLKVVAALHVGTNYQEVDFDHMAALRDKYSHGNLRATSAKIFSDGVIETHTAAMLEPYLGTKGNRGTLNYEPAELNRIVAALDRRKFQVHIHAIGDRAVRAALDAFDGAKKADKTDGNSEYFAHRHHIAHLEVVQKEDQKRFKGLGVTANFQSYWAFNDPYMLELTAPTLGKERMQLVYPINSILKNGAKLAAGSDWSVSTLNPFRAMQVAVTRQEIGDGKAVPLLPSERVKVKDILDAYTTGGAFINHSEASTGSLEKGKAADFIVIDRDIFAIDPHQIGATRVLKTFVDGRLVFDRSLPQHAKVSE